MLSNLLLMRYRDVRGFRGFNSSNIFGQKLLKKHLSDDRDMCVDISKIRVLNALRKIVMYKI